MSCGQIHAQYNTREEAYSYTHTHTHTHTLWLDGRSVMDYVDNAKEAKLPRMETSVSMLCDRSAILL